MEGLGNLPPPSNDPVRQYMIDHAGQIDKLSFKASILPVITGVFCGVAVVAALVRLVARAMRRRTLYRDDYLVLFAVLSLGAATGVLYHWCDALFLVQAMSMEGFIPTRTEIMPILNTMKWVYIYVALTWSCIFAIKLAFFSFFHPLLLGMARKFLIYYWFAVIFTICCWILFLLQPLIPCRNFGLDAVNTCYRNPSLAKNMAPSIVAAVLDIITDAMKTSIKDNEPNEPSYDPKLTGFRLLPIPDDSYSVCVHLDALRSNNQTGKLDRKRIELALFNMGLDLALTEDFWNLSYVILMFLTRATKDQDIIQVQHYELAQHLYKPLVYKALKSR
ncbi:hypothetical protein EPUS_01052 [Endocarpon pusillum Z07020]|uniref:Uncharacterized protein n=1 Tax=Endocarpon pusillum (strain Z07020 / HMAS-L-300199) TaxID=1263415 RepID=U1GBN1_ENDPU|nr:uncharacterized protein EPUS_01052 [Endocarpon pusillum Z07020]ERF69096.1 hypothetical protein EPUS_01052 [Endocarpon pusillum Z07020]